MRKLLFKVFGNPKGRAIVNGIVALMWIVLGFTAETGFMTGLYALNAALFASSASQNLSEHVYSRLLDLKDELIEHQDRLIDDLYTALKLEQERDAS
jgi:hypothetical protein